VSMFLRMLCSEDVREWGSGCELYALERVGASLGVSFTGTPQHSIQPQEPRKNSRDMVNHMVTTVVVITQESLLVLLTTAPGLLSLRLPTSVNDGWYSSWCRLQKRRRPSNQ
jgi:hypothetical protein